MSSTASADPSALKEPDQTVVNPPSDIMDSNHDDLPAQTLAERDNHNTSEKDDAATMAASEELKHTTISDKVLIASTLELKKGRLETAAEDKNMEETVKEGTPELELTAAQDEEMKEKLSSPKKKRGRDTYDESKDIEGDNVDEGSSADGSAVNGSRLEREGPEKKRHRDTSEDPLKAAEKAAEVKEIITSDPLDTTKTTSTEPDISKKASASSPKPTFGSVLDDKPQTSASAFANSGFSSLAGSSTSPFGTIGASKPSVFGGNTQSTTSGFSTLTSAKSPSPTSTITTSSFGGLSGDKPPSGFGFGSTSTSGFGALGSGSVFGSALGNGFAGGSGPKLSSFAAPGKSDVPFSKPAKAFGAPESDKDDGSDDEGSDEGADSDEEGTKDATDEKKKSKITKVHVEDGESGEATLVQLRAKLFALDSKEAGWKERGIGTLKVNVPRSCASFDENGVAIPGSFDVSGLEDEEEEEESNGPRVPRLIMRQENTHRVILNTIIVKAMEFKDKPSTSTAQILFTAFEGEKEPKPINMLLKMSETNARAFRAEIGSIQREL